jgi:UPF0755 protein
MEDFFNPFKELLRIAGVALLACALVAVGWLFDFWMFLHMPGLPERGLRQVLIHPGMGARAIAHALKTEGVVADGRKFYWFCLATASSGRLRAGEYAFQSLATPWQVLDKLTRGEVVQRRVTFPEGSTLRNVARILAGAGLAEESQILRLGADESFVRSQGIEAKSLEGYLFPETYHFQKTQDNKALMETMLKEFRLRFSYVWQERARELGFSVHEILTLASLVEKEARVDAERPLIAAVFLNRLKRRMPLQSDPTAVYDLADFSGPVTHDHLQRFSAYNTYQIKGLPPGPICNPGAKSIEAVLFPADVPYVYFVSNLNGTHQFSTSIEEHNTAVRNYRQKLREQAKTPDAAENVQLPPPDEAGREGEPK